MPARTILILGGTREAAVLAERLNNHEGIRVVTSLAGRTENPAPVAGEVRIGGFGGADGLAAYLQDERIDLLVDATHPFAARISKNAAEAVAKTGTQRLVFVRPEWKPSPADQWEMVDTTQAAAEALPADARAFLALGGQDLSAFSGREDCWFLVRMIDPPSAPLALPAHDIVLGRPAGDPLEEEELLRLHAVTHMVCRNSGGVAASAKLVAARDLAIPVIMIRRPPRPEGELFSALDDLVAAIG